MELIQSELESLVNNPSKRCFQANQIFAIWEDFFPESKTMQMSELQHCIDRIGEVCKFLRPILACIFSNPTKPYICTRKTCLTYQELDTIEPK